MRHLLSKDQVWRFQGQDVNHKPLSLKTVLPMDSASVLLDHNKIPHPYYKSQEHACYWIHERDWIFETTYELDASTVSLLKKKNQFLILDLTWLDTHAHIYINDRKIGETSNMFDRFTFDVSNKVVVGKNVLRIVLLSIKKLADTRARKSSLPIPYSKDNNVFPHMNMVRKVQCHAGWDWGIALMVSGVYAPPTLTLHKMAKAMYLTHRQKMKGSKVEIEVSLHVQAYKSGKIHVVFELEGEHVHKDVAVVEGMQEISTMFEIHSPKLWWPARHGEQHLYNLRASISSDASISSGASHGAQSHERDTHDTSAQSHDRDTHDTGANSHDRDTHDTGAQSHDRDTHDTGAQSHDRDTHDTGAQSHDRDTHDTSAQSHDRDTHDTGAQSHDRDTHDTSAQSHDRGDTHGMHDTTDSIHQKIGIREITWICEKDAHGKSMTLCVNGKKIFCKGANWIPCDAMPSKQAKKYKPLLEAARDANMNMLRVWGGGQYERDEFYALCDEMGIMVWQDMMFACALYSSEQWFLDEVRGELAHQIRRISHHPSIAIYCGDNEVIGAIDWYEESKRDKVAYTVNYDRLSRTIAETLQQYDDTRMFWASSPSNGDLDFGDAWHDDNKGDMHYWEVWHSGASFESYYSIKPRFCSEFGFQSFPSIPTIASFTTTDQYNITSPDMEHHQKNHRGNSIILEMFSRYFRIPNSFEQQVYLSQLQQSLAITLGIEFWRSLMPICMGTLYWQLNDNWPVTSWSSIEYTDEYYGRWKQLHYQIKRVYNPLLVTARLQESHLIDKKTGNFSKKKEKTSMNVGINRRIVYGVVNDGDNTHIHLEGGVYDLKGTCIYDMSGTHVACGNTSTELNTITLSDERVDVTRSFVYFRYYELQGTKKIYIGEKTLFLCPPKRVHISIAHITIKSRKLSAGMFEIVMQADKPAFFVFLELWGDAGTCNENCVSILPKQKKKIIYTSHTDMTINTFKEMLQVTCLNDIGVL